MRYPPLGHFKTVDAFNAHLGTLDPDVRAATTLAGRDGPLGWPLEVHGRRLDNRFAVHPMEGWDGTEDGLPTPDTLRRWRRFGASGAALIWGGEAFAVEGRGRANPHQLFLNDDADAAGGLRALLAAVHEGRASIGAAPDAVLVGLQLTHSGRFARPTAAGPRPAIVHHHPVLAARYGLDPDAPLLEDDALAAIGDRFVRAAVLAADTGFDFVDVKCCHGYLLHELLGAHAAKGPYGGSFENRTRLLVGIIEGIRAACPDLAIGVRVSITDLYPFAKDETTGVGVPRGLETHVPYRYGFGVDAARPLEADLDEPFRLLELLRGLGVRMINVTIGSPYYCPHRQRPAAYPPSDGYDPPEDPLHGVIAHLRAVRTCKAAFPDMLFVGSGYSYLQEFLPAVAQAEIERGHVDFVGLGRMILSYPDLPRDVLAGAELQRKLICRTFSDCTTAPRHDLPSGCYPLDPHYRGRPQAVELRTIKKRLRAASLPDEKQP